MIAVLFGAFLIGLPLGVILANVVGRRKVAALAEYNVGDLVWFTPSWHGGSAEKARMIDMSKNRYFIERPYPYGIHTVTFEEGRVMLALRDEEK